MSEKFCLKWNDFQTNTSSTFAHLRNDNDFADVTLITEDEQQIEVHKVVISAASPFFSNILKKIKHSHPLLYMKGMRTNDLSAILDFMYYGEVNLFQEDLDKFLSLADEIKLRGLSGEASVRDEYEEENSKYTPEPSAFIETTPVPKPIVKESTETIFKEKIPLMAVIDNFDLKYETPENKISTFKEDKLNIERVEDLDKTIKSVMYKQIDGTWKCTLCGKIPPSGKKHDLMKHVEARHTSGISHPCNICGNSFRLKRKLIEHISKMHKFSLSI